MSESTVALIFVVLTLRNAIGPRRIRFLSFRVFVAHHGIDHRIDTRIVTRLAIPASEPNVASSEAAYRVPTSNLQLTRRRRRLAT
jgi:hypothetical protein